MLNKIWPWSALAALAAENEDLKRAHVVRTGSLKALSAKVNELSRRNVEDRRKIRELEGRLKAVDEVAPIETYVSKASKLGLVTDAPWPYPTGAKP